jgi:hypothetical protein
MGERSLEGMRNSEASCVNSLNAENFDIYIAGWGAVEKIRS